MSMRADVFTIQVVHRVRVRGVDDARGGGG